MTPTWHIRPYRAGDEHAILALRRAVFGAIDPVRLELATWHWQFRDNPAGPPCCCLAEDRGAIVGQYVVVPSRFCVNGKPRTLYLSCDTMTHPRYQRQGMFTALARATYALLAERQKDALVWGFPNTSSLPGFVRHLGWQALAEYPLRVVPLRPLVLLGAVLSFVPRTLNRRRRSPPRDDGARWLPRFPGLQIESIDCFGHEADLLWQRHRNLASVIQVRDASYLNWRYRGVAAFGYRCFAVTFKGQVRGYLVLRLLELMGHYVGVVVDLFPFPVVDPGITRNVLRFARRYCRIHGAGFMTALIPSADPRFLASAGFIKIPNRFNPRPWFLGIRQPQPQSCQALCDARNWHVTYGETDIV